MRATPLLKIEPLLLKVTSPPTPTRKKPFCIHFWPHVPQPTLFGMFSTAQLHTLGLSASAETVLTAASTLESLHHLLSHFPALSQRASSPLPSSLIRSTGRVSSQGDHLVLWTVGVHLACSLLSSSRLSTVVIPSPLPHLQLIALLFSSMRAVPSCSKSL